MRVAAQQEAGHVLAANQCTASLKSFDAVGLLSDIGWSTLTRLGRHVSGLNTFAPGGACPRVHLGLPADRYETSTLDWTGDIFSP